MDSGQQALAYLRSCSPEEGPALILLDYEMPQMTGGDLLRSLTTIGWLAAIPKVLWSHSSRYFVRCEGLGVREFIIKPESQESMESVAGEVARIMNTKQPK